MSIEKAQKMAEWIDVRERRPEDSTDRVAVLWRGGGMDVYPARYVLGLLNDERWGRFVNYWFPMPPARPPFDVHTDCGGSE